MPVESVTPEQWASFTLIVSGADGDREKLVPRNLMLVRGEIEAMSKAGGDKFMDARMRVCGYLPVMGNMAARVDMVSGTVHEVMYKLDKMIMPPRTAAGLSLQDHAGVFERSECMFLSMLLFFPSAGCSGVTLCTPTARPTWEQARLMFNAMIGHAEAFKDEMKKQGLDLDAKQLIIPKGSSRLLR